MHRSVPVLLGNYYLRCRYDEAGKGGSCYESDDETGSEPESENKREERGMPISVRIFSCYWE